jgi:pimeloyl-ACP methyl ester carboxylesterase
VKGPAAVTIRTVVRGALLFSAVLVSSMAIVSTPAVGAGPFRACGARVECALVPVPLDRSGKVPGTVTLNVRRMRARRQSNGAIVGLAGGPGQAALPFLSDFADEMRAGLRSRDLIVFDQRGTGRSGLLRCPPLERTTDVDPAPEIQRCADALGPGRSSYTSSDSVEDIEAVRRVAGVERITLYGISYGTKVALAYAARYPAHVERLVLDSVVPLDGPDFFTRETFRATPRVLRTLCARRACSGITRDPVTDLAALVSRLARGPLRGRVIGGDGRARARQLGRLRLVRILSAGDFEPSFRAELPAAVRAALRGDSAPILRLAGRTARFDAIPERPQDFSPALYLSTVCEEGPLPWEPAASLQDRWGQAIARAQSLPPSDFYPFDRATARAADTLRACAHWPAGGTAQPLAASSLPKVPALLLSGEQDLRTPIEEADRVAKQIPGSTSLHLPGTGHGALLNDLSGCAERAVNRFFAGLPIGPVCPRSGQFLRELFSVTSAPSPIPPRSLRDVRPPPGTSGRRGRTIGAFASTIADAFFHQLYESGLFDLAPPFPIGGLRGGRIRTNGRLDRYQFVRGVSVTDITRSRKRPSLLGGPRRQRFVVFGPAASDGILTLDKKAFSVRGRLGGHRVDVNLLGDVDAEIGKAAALARRARPGYRCCLVPGTREPAGAWR